MNHFIKCSFAKAVICGILDSIKNLKRMELWKNLILEDRC